MSYKRKLVLFCCLGTVFFLGLVNLGVLFCFARPVVVIVSDSSANINQLPINDFHDREHYINNVLERKDDTRLDSLMQEITESDALIEHDVCKRNNISLLVLIFSSPPNSERRNVIRGTWLSDFPNSIRYLFVLANSEHEGVQKQIKTENAENKDILLLDFIDSYKNLTLKTISSFRWATKNCKTTEYILKIDDDVWLNRKPLINILSRGMLKGALGGSCNHGAQPVRDPNSKYYVSKNTFPESFYPTFCSGTAYVVDFQLIKNIVEISKSTPFFPLEDIYVAICVKKLKAKILNLYGFNAVHVKANPCWLKSDWLITTHDFLPFELRHVWQTKCNGLFPIRERRLTFRPMPDIGGSIYEKRRQMNKLRMQEMFHGNARVRKPVKFYKKELLFN